MSETIGIADTAKRIIADLTNEKDQIAAAIETMEGKLAGQRLKLADLDAAIGVLMDTYRLKTRTAEPPVAKAAPAVRGRAVKITDPKKKKPIEIKTAVREYIAVNLNFPVKELVAAVRLVRPDAQQPSIQAELTKLMKAGELDRVGYGLYQSKVYKAGSEGSSAPEATETPEDAA